MSIAALADTRLQRTEATTPSVDGQPKIRAGVPAGLLNTLAQWVPTETVAGYVAIQASMSELKAKTGQQLCVLNFADRWMLFGLMFGLSIVLVPIYTKIKTNNSSTKFEWPVLEMGISAIAFCLWVVALADSPFNDWCALEAWHSVSAIVIGGALLGGLTAMLKKSPAWSENKANNVAPSPEVK